jgi:ATP-dependent Lon protease
MMPIRDIVMFPFMMSPFVVGRESSVRALEAAMAGDKMIFLATQHDASSEEPRPGEIYSVGCIVKIIQSFKEGDRRIKVLLEGVERARVVSVTNDEGFFRAIVRVDYVRDKVDPGLEVGALASRVTSLLEQYMELSQSLNHAAMSAAIRVDDPGKLADMAAANLQLTIEEKQELLETFDPTDRLARMAEMLEVEIGRLRADRTVYRPGQLRTSQGKSETRSLPTVPIRDVVVFPFMMIPFMTGRESAVRALEAALAGDKMILLETQKDASAEPSDPDGIYRVGCIARIVQALKRGDGHVQVLVEGLERARILSTTDEDGFFRALVEASQYEVEPGQDLELESLTSHVVSLFEQYVRRGSLGFEAMAAAIRVDNPRMLADTTGANLQLSIRKKQELLEIFDPVDRLVRVAEILEIETGRQATRSPAPR